MNTAETIIEKFGTQQNLAKALGIRQSNVSYWAKVGSIPTRWHTKIIDAAGRLAIPISAGDFLIETPIADSAIQEKTKITPPPQLKVVKSGELDIAGIKVPVAVLSNGKRVIFQREMVGLLTGNKKGGLQRYLSAANLQPFVPLKFKGKDLEDVVFVFPYKGNLTQGFEGTDLIELCDMYLKARQATTEDGKPILLAGQKDLALQAEIITRSFAKLGVVAAIDEATGFQKEKDEYQKLLSQYIAEELQPWIKTFGENYYFQIYRLKGWDWETRRITDRKNHPWEVAKITNRIVYEKLPSGIIDKLRELNPKNESGNRKHRNFQFLTPNAGYVHMVKHLGHVEAIMERHTDGDWFKALHEIDARFPSQRDPYGNALLPFKSNVLVQD
jgi:hypothetical protein